jgi:hypothetical protein
MPFCDVQHYAGVDYAQLIRRLASQMAFEATELDQSDLSRYATKTMTDYQLTL